MEFGKGSITAWLRHYNRLINLGTGSRLDSDLKIIIDFTRATQDNRRKYMQELNESKADNGWENCHKPVTKIFTSQKIREAIEKTAYRYDTDQTEFCPECKTNQAKRVFGSIIIDGIDYRLSQCRLCCHYFYRPIYFGIDQTQKEKILE